MSRRALLTALLLSACGGGESAQAPAASGSGAVSAAPAASAAKAKGTAAEERPESPRPRPPRLPKGDPVPLERFAGVFPPKWRVGDTWRVLVMRQTSGVGTASGRSSMERFEYVFRVAGAPATPGEGEYRLKVVRRKDVSESYTIRFSGADGSLLRVDLDRKPTWDDPRDVRLGFPVVRKPGQFYRYGTLHPVASFPCLPAVPEKNPTVVQTIELHGLTDGAWLTWQLVEPEGEGLRFRLGQVFVPAADSTWPYDSREEVTMLWRRGDPWWSLLTESAIDERNENVDAAEIIGGRLVLGRLLQPGERGELW